MDNDITKINRIASQAIYQVTVKGKLDERWSDWFNGTTLSIENDLPGNPCTVLTCKVRDQAELFGILNRLNSLNLPLLKVVLMAD
jgi:hypothetical protein